MAMKTPRAEMGEAEAALRQKEAELILELRTRNGIAIERSADQMDEIQYASERDLSIQNVDRELVLLRAVKAALKRIRDGDFGKCVECDSEIGPMRLAAVPWAPRCIRCQDAEDRLGCAGAETIGDFLVRAA
jgi:DnaK suppressor protein